MRKEVDPDLASEVEKRSNNAQDQGVHEAVASGHIECS